MKTYTEAQLAELREQFTSRDALRKGVYSAYKFAQENDLLDLMYGPSRSKPKSFEQWLRQARAIHRDNYSYELVKWSGYSTKTAKKVEVICHKCKDTFFISPVKHIAEVRLQGCTICSRKKQTEAQRDTTNTFIEKALKVHGRRYDYTRVAYVDSRTPVDITCLIHGSFAQRPNGHLRGSGCPDCAHILTGERCRLGAEEFINKSLQRHGKNRYDYSRVLYVNAHIKVEILCDSHGPFWQSPNKHANAGNGCPQCGFERSAESSRLSLSHFVQRANKVHKGKYNYSKSDYSNYSNPIVVTCTKHGDFEISPSNHLAGKGCRSCGFEASATKQKLTKGEWLKRCREQHDRRYNYKNSIYLGFHEPITILCSEHGEFEQIARTHSIGCGCPSCGKEQSIDGRRLTKKQFIERARKIHGDNYDYSNVSYVNNTTKVEILCELHGAFAQAPSHHLNGTGCPNCHFKSEARISSLLERLCVTFETQFRLGGSRFDYFLPDHNYVIERDGEQHYFDVEVFSRGDSFYLQKQQRNDAFKTKLAKIAGYKIARIPFWLTEAQELDELKNIIADRPSYPETPKLSQADNRPPPKR